MELESLKYVWHSLDAAPAGEADRRALLALLAKNARGPVARMRRNLVGEAVILLIAYTPAVLLFLEWFDGRLAAISWLFIGIGVFFLAYYFMKFRLLAKMECPGCQVRSNLARQVRRLKGLTAFYVIAGTVTIPLSWLLAYGIVRWRYSGGSSGFGVPHVAFGVPHVVPWWASPLCWLIALVPLTIGLYFANRWYVNRLYGRHIKKLQELLREMESE